MIRRKLEGGTLKDVRSEVEESDDSSNEFSMNETKKTL